MYTPGPWKHKQIGTKRGTVVSMCSGFAYKEIAFVPLVNSKAENAANAALIAAAPELLEAAEGLMRCLGDHLSMEGRDKKVDIPDLCPCHLNEMQAALAVIAKAKGGK